MLMFWMGVGATILAEVLLAVGFCFFASRAEKKYKNDDDF